MNIKELYLKACEQHKAGKHEAALKIFDKIIRRAPDYKDAYYMSASCWRELNNFVKEYSALKKLLELLNISSPGERIFASRVLSHIGNACTDLSLLKEAKEVYDLMITLSSPPKPDCLSSAIFLGNALEDSSPDYFLHFYSEYKKNFIDIKPYPKRFYDHKKIRVGFLSADFCRHTTMTWSWSLMTGLDKNVFEIYFYSNGKVKDYITEHLRSIAEGWHDIFNLTDEEAAELIYNDEIDILFDLSGHTSGNRLCIAAYRPATVQMSGIGYMNSTGLECFDYFLSDIYCAGDESYFTEQLIRLPHSHFCYEPLTKKLDPVDFPPCIKNGFITFGSFNKFYKMSDSILITWKKILDAVPDSRLILKAKMFNTKEGKTFAGEKLKNFGFDLKQIEMRPHSTNHLVEYGDVDIALDTFPYTGGVTTCEALYMGVPVVSLYGDRHGSRFGLSILKNVGLEELAVDSYDEYIKRALMLASDWDLLTLLRKNLRTMMMNSQLLDSESYVREIKNAFIKILSDAGTSADESYRE